MANIIYARSGSGPQSFDQTLTEAVKGTGFTVEVTETLSRKNPLSGKLVLLDSNFVQNVGIFLDWVTLWKFCMKTASSQNTPTWEKSMLR